MLRYTLAPLLALGIVPQESPRPPRFDAGMRTEMTLRARHTWVYQRPVVRINWQDVDFPHGAPERDETTSERELVILETVEQASDGARERVVQHYNKLHLTTDGESHESPLQGETLRLTRTAKNAVMAEMVSSGEVPEAYLEHHTLDGAARIYLEDLGRPPKVRESWKLSDEALARFGAPLGIFFESDFGYVRLREKFGQDYEVEVNVTYRGVAELDNMTCAVLEAKGTYALDVPVGLHDLPVEIPDLGLPDDVEVEGKYWVKGRSTTTVWLALEEGRVLLQTTKEDMDWGTDWEYVSALGERVEHFYVSSGEGTTTQRWVLLGE